MACFHIGSVRCPECTVMMPVQMPRPLSPFEQDMLQSIGKPKPQVTYTLPLTEPKALDRIAKALERIADAMEKTE